MIMASSRFGFLALWPVVKTMRAVMSMCLLRQRLPIPFFLWMPRIFWRGLSVVL